jgi:hypothetical protein
LGDVRKEEAIASTSCISLQNHQLPESFTSEIHMWPWMLLMTQQSLTPSSVCWLSSVCRCFTIPKITVENKSLLRKEYLPAFWRPAFWLQPWHKLCNLEEVMSLTYKAEVKPVCPKGEAQFKEHMRKVCKCKRLSHYPWK